MVSPVHRRVVYRFGLFEVFVESRELFKQGRRIRLQDQPFEFLLLLVEQSGEVVSRESVRLRLWPEDTFVEFDQSLGTAVTKLRHALGDTADNPRFIETVPRRGYRFLAPVTVSNSTAPADLKSGTEEPPADAPAVLDGGSEKKANHRRTWIAVTALAALLAGMVTVVFPFNHAGSTYALSNSDTICLGDFVNKSGDPAFDDGLKQALSISLAQSPFLNIVPDHKVRETLKLMGRSPEERVTGEAALEVCQRTASKAILAGSITNFGSQLVIGLQAVNCQTGAVFVQEQIEASRKEDVLNSLGEASTQLRKRLGESLSMIQIFDTPLEQATTPSLEALKAYSKGLKARNGGEYADAILFLKHAIELDPKFAVAYGVLGASYQSLGEDGLGSQYAQEAYGLRERTTERERFAITNYYNNFVLGDRAEALQNCRLWAESYPRDLTPHICLFFDTEMLGQYEKALPEGVRCVAADPDAGICYADLIANYAALNRLDDAKATCQQALAHKLDSADLHAGRYAVAFLEDDTAEMERQLAWAAGKPGAEDMLLWAQAETEAFHGRFARARELTRRATEFAVRSDQKESAARWQIRSALREALAGNNTRATQQTTAALRYASFEFLSSMAAVTQALAGVSTPAEKIAADLGRTYPADTMLHDFWLPAVRAAIEIDHKRPGKAIEDLQPAVSVEMGEHLPFLPAYLRGQAYLAVLQGAEAAGEFQKLIDHRGLVQNSVLGALAHLGLGRASALEMQSLQGAKREVARRKALSAYQDFLKLWKDADPDIPVLQQAKAEYAKLQ